MGKISNSLTTEGSTLRPRSRDSVASDHSSVSSAVDDLNKQPVTVSRPQVSPAGSSHSRLDRSSVCLVSDVLQCSARPAAASQQAAAAAASEPANEIVAIR